MRNATWENIGTNVSGEKRIEDVLTTAGLNYTVEKRPVYRYERNPRKLVRIKNKFTCERREDGHSYDEIVSNKYTIVQNREAFDFVNYMSDEVEFLKAGETSNGLVYIIGKLPDVNILGDQFTPHVIFSNSFTGKTSIRAAISSAFFCGASAGTGNIASRTIDTCLGDTFIAAYPSAILLSSSM